ncbi:MAG TPA: sigma-54 dependent transcriptional regulator [Candidatus Udaeobacter sp.]|jgi:DNA-binding NtrC family response regulator|nr:sigma-54 dependent transcriptional regulator [Candidatus Udaeobacter sp.]
MVVSTHPPRVLVVDDEPEVARVIARLAESFGHEVVIAKSVDEALARFGEAPFDVVLTDLRLGREDGLALLRSLQSRAPDVPVVVITGQATIDSAMEAIGQGAYDYLAKPIERGAIGDLLSRALERRRLAEAARSQSADFAPPYALENIAGHSAAMIDVYKTVARVAAGRSSVLILGESGTGKELVARSLHSQSARRDRRFVPVNVSAIPEGLLESELFGHVRGAFTGATSARRGLFEEAHQGTLFLDEIGDLSPMLQAKLLRVIQEQSLKPVGGNEEVKVDVRIVAATHRHLEEMVRKGTFREDLYFRINVVSIALPALRERPEDIPVLIEHFLRKFEQQNRVPAPRCTPGALSALMSYNWPGNVRELENVVERAVLLSRDGAITLEALPPHVLGGSAPRPLPQFPTLDQTIDRYVTQVLHHTRGNRTEAARILGISRRTLHRMEERKRAEQAKSEDQDRDNLSRGASS